MNSIASRVKLPIIITVSAIVSWIIVHIVTVFGLFLAVAYPLFWFISPKHTVCVFCHTRKEGQLCPFCKRTIVKGEGSAPKTLLSAILNSTVLLVFSFVSIALVFGEYQLLQSIHTATPKSVSFSIPSTAEYKLGEIFSLQLGINGVKTPINAIQTDIAYDPKQLEVVDISTQNSFATIFIQKEINNQTGYARLTGGLPNPGYAGENGIFGTVYFRAKTPGLTTVRFLPSSLVLANDGKGTNVLKDFGTISYLILPEQAESQVNIAPKNVLGVSTSSATQMIFYDDKQPTEDSTNNADTQDNQPVTIDNSLVNAVVRVDTAILRVWGRIL